MFQNSIIVVGYPKAGNTGLARLIRTAIGGQICNFRGEENWIDSADKGSGKIKIFKTHNPSWLTMDSEIIYVLRDPLTLVLSGFYHNKPWLKGKSIMNTILGDIWINLYCIVYGCKWPGLALYKNHYLSVLKYDPVIIKYEDLWTGEIKKDVLNRVFRSEKNFVNALANESKSRKALNFSRNGDTKSLNFLKDYNRSVIIWSITRALLRNRSGAIWFMYHD
jgi:hypothetical protein